MTTPASTAPSSGTATTEAVKVTPAPPPPKILRDSPIIPLIMIGAGAYLLWFGVKYWRGTGPATWPSYPIKSVLQGKGLPKNQQATTAEVTLASYETGAGALGGGSTYSGPIPYRNPFRQVQNLTPERIDMGVDYQGVGPIYAPGPGVITESDTAWAGGVGAVGPGTFIVEQLTAGPLAGKYVYFSENITPRARVGQQVDTNTIIGYMTGQGAGIETGFAAGPTGGTTLAMATGQASTSGDPGANTTAFGRAWSDVLAFLGAPPGVQGGPDKGTLPAGWWTGGGGTPSTGRPQNIARLLLANYGWDASQFPALVSLWNQESGWSTKARNPRSHALGIAQALGHGGADTAGSLGNEYGTQFGLNKYDAQAANSGDALQQIRWGFGYISAKPNPYGPTYGSPKAAWAHEQAYGWY